MSRKKKIEFMISKLIKSEKWLFPILIFTVIIAAFHFFMIPGMDDEWFAAILDNQSFYAYAVNRWEGWSSRLIVEGILIFLVRSPAIVWKVLDILVWTGLLILLGKIFIPDGKVQEKYDRYFILVCLAFLYPVVELSSAGWISTTVNYLWPAFFALLGMYPIKKVIHNEKFFPVVYPFYIIALLIGSNHEQGVLITIGIYVVFCIWLFLQKRSSIFLYVQLGLAVLEMLVISLCPGNRLRSAYEIAHHNPAFSEYGLLKKFELGIAKIFYETLVKPNYLFIALTFLVCLLIFMKYKGVKERLAGVTPLTLSFILGFSMDYVPYVRNTNLGIFSTWDTLIQDKGFFNEETLHTAAPYIAILLGLLMGTSLLIGICLVIEDKTKRFICIWILLLGLASMGAMGFSPTIWFSGSRTNFMMNISFLAASAMLLGEWKYIDENTTAFLKIVLGLGAILGIIIDLAMLNN